MNQNDPIPTNGPLPVPDADCLKAAYVTARDALLAERTPEGFWVGELSSSALATAVACIALKLTDGAAHRERIEKGLAWLTATQNADGGWGDTTRSKSNISTTALCWAALGDAFARHDDALERARKAAVGALAKLHDALDERQRRILANWLEARGRGGPYRGDEGSARDDMA